MHECCEFNMEMECFIPEDGVNWTCPDCGEIYTWNDLEGDWIKNEPQI